MNESSLVIPLIISKSSCSDFLLSSEDDLQALPTRPMTTSMPCSLAIKCQPQRGALMLQVLAFNYWINWSELSSMAKASKVESSTAKSVIRLTLHVLSGFVLFMNNSSASAQTFFRLPPTDITIHNPDSTKVNDPDHNQCCWSWGCRCQFETCCSFIAYQHRSMGLGTQGSVRLSGKISASRSR